MVWRFLISLLTAALVASTVSAQIVRFETSVGSFDMVLNPTDRVELAPHVANLVQYVASGRYSNTVINRAAKDFVLQMGLFQTPGPTMPPTVDGFVPIETFAEIEGVPAGEVGVSNTIGTVGYAIRGSQSGPLIDTVQSSFYINLTNNQFLDEDFTVFARIANMSTVNTIMALPQIDLTDDDEFGAGLGNLAFSDIPLQSNGELVLITRAYVVEQTITTPGDYNRDGQIDAADYTVWRDSRGSLGAGLKADGDGDGVVNHYDYLLWKTRFGGVNGSAASGGMLLGVAVPEPAGAVLVLGAMASFTTALVRALRR